MHIRPSPLLKIETSFFTPAWSAPAQRWLASGSCGDRRRSSIRDCWVRIRGGDRHNCRHRKNARRQQRRGAAQRLKPYIAPDCAWAHIKLKREVVHQVLVDAE